MRFFEPSPEWITWAVKYAGNRTILDVGCGEGHVARALAAKGAKVIGIDFRPMIDGTGAIVSGPRAGDPSGLRFVNLNVLSYRGQQVIEAPVNLPVFCRPCHGGWVSDAIESRDGVILLVGLPGNLAADIGPDTRDDCVTPPPAGVGVTERGNYYRRTDAPTGPEGEVTWEVAPDPSYFKAADPASARKSTDLWYLIEQSNGLIAWWLLHTEPGPRGRPHPPDKPDGYWVSSYGGGFQRSAEPVLQTSDVDGWFDLDMTPTTQWKRLDARQSDESLVSGWIDPDGKLYRCGYNQHDSLATIYLRKETFTLEREGWARLHSGNVSGPPFARTGYGKELTEAQAALMLRLDDEWEAQNAARNRANGPDGEINEPG